MTAEHLQEQDEMHEAQKQQVIIESLSSLLSECLESMNQDNSFKVLGIENNKLIVEFDIVEIDDEFMFQGY